MSDWQMVTLEDVTESINTGLDAIRRAPIVEHKTNLRCLRIQDISQNKSFDKWGYTEVKDTDFKKFQLVPNDIIMARTCSTGICYLVKEELPAVFNNGLARIRLKIEKVDPQFIYYVFKSKHFSGYIDGISGGTSVQLNMKIGDLSKYQFKLPPLSEQKEIARILSDLDKKIELNTQINQTLEQIAQALFKSWFVDFDPVRAKVQALSDGLSLEQAELSAMQAISGKTPEELTALSQTQPDRYAELAETAKAFPCEMVEVDGVEVPKGWEIKPFGSLLENTIGGDWGKEEEDEKHTENVFVFRGTDLPNIQTNEFEAIPKRYIAKNKLKSRKAKYGDIIIEVSGGSKNQPTGRSLLITKNLLCNFDLPVIPASFCRLFTPINEKIAVLLACHLKMIYTQGKTWEYQLQSTGISNFQTKNFLENELIVIPDENIFNTFYEKVGVIFEKMTSNENMLLSKTRDLLLPRLLNGDFCAHV